MKYRHTSKYLCFFSIVLFILPLGSQALLADIQRDVVYGQADGLPLFLDVHVPDGKGPFPVLILVHGGGWSRGDKEQNFASLFESLSQARFVWFSINYRLAPIYPYPACLEDVETAVRWVKAHAAEYRGDARKTVLIGESAGGHLVDMATVRATAETQAAAVVAFYAPVDFIADNERRGGVSKGFTAVFGIERLDEEGRRQMRTISPLFALRPGLPPFLLIHGTEDRSVLYSQSVTFQKRLQELGVPCELITVPNAQHGLPSLNEQGTDYREKMIAWIFRTLKTDPSSLR